MSSDMSAQVKTGRPLSRDSGGPVLCFDEVEETDSTNAEMRRRLLRGEELFGLRAERQTAGRGRLRRSWHTGAGNLAASYCLRLPLEAVTPLPLVAGLAVLDALRGLGFREARCKWPNDITVDKLKLCGILCECVIGDGKVLGSIVGVGLNIAMSRGELAEVDKPCVSLRVLQEEGRFDGELPTAGQLFRLIGQKLAERSARLEKEGFEPLSHAWSAHCSHLGEWVSVLADGSRVEGRTLGVGPQGQLLLRQGDGDNDPLKEIWLGDVQA